MASDANPPGPPHAADEARFAEISEALVVGVEQAVPGWIERLVLERVQAHRGAVPAEVGAAAAEAGRAARQQVVADLRALNATDLDAHRANPLAILRRATGHAHAVLAAAGVPPVVRDEFAERSFPDDVYALAPATWADVDPALHDLGLAWGAAKAFLFKARRRAEGRR